MTKEAKKAAKLEKKLKVLTGRYVCTTYSHIVHIRMHKVRLRHLRTVHTCNAMHTYSIYVSTYMHTHITHVQVYTDFVLLIGCF